MPQPPPQVPQTKRSTYRPMKLMNGDFLTQLKRPLCSELGPEIKGTNKGKQAQCKHTVGLWYKDQTFSLRKITKAEDAVYETFLQVHKEKRKLQKDAYRKKQEEARRLADDARRKALDTMDVLILPEETEKHAARATEEVKLPALSTSTKVSKVIEVVKMDNSKGDTEIKTGEDASDHTTVTDGSDKSRPSVSNSADLQLPTAQQSVETNEHGENPDEFTEESCPPHEDEQSKTSRTKKVHKKITKALSKGDLIANMTEDSNKTVMKRRTGLSNFLITPQNISNEAEVLSKQLATKTTYRKSFTNIMPVINEDEHGGVEVSLPVTTQTQPLTVSYESVFSVPLVSESEFSTLTSPESARSEPDAGKNDLYASESLVKINKKKKRDMENKRKMILDMEPFQTYTRDPNGDILPAVFPFRKKTFSPPSEKERYFQKKMLTAQKDARASQDQKIEDFYKKLDVDRDKAYFIRQRVPTPVEKYEDMAPTGASLEQLAHIYQHRHVHIPEGVDPQSIEAMQYCQYIRTHDFNTPKRRGGTRPRHNVF